MEKELLDNRRILLVDDHEPIHDDFRDILGRPPDLAPELDDLEAAFFGQAVVTSMVLPSYGLDSAFQGEEALAKVAAAVENGTPYALAFMDVRMPPGWDGIETIRHVWSVDPDVQVVICTAYADYTWEEIYRDFGDTDGLVFLRKPFDHTEVRQLASSLTAKWNATQAARRNADELESLVAERTRALQRTVAGLEQAMSEVRTLSGLLPICAGCKKIRDDAGFWSEVESYVSAHTTAIFSHSLCPDCVSSLYPETITGGE